MHHSRAPHLSPHTLRLRSVKRWLTMFASLVLTLLIAACAPVQTTSPASSSASTAAQDAELAESGGAVPVYESWEDVLAAAEGTTVNWFMWGGSDNINQQVDTHVGEPLLAQYGVTLNRVPLENTADAINKVLNEKAAGKESDGSIDLIWINGENFRTLKEAELLYGPISDLLPNSEYVNWEDPAVAFDFGMEVEGYESPWASFQWVMEYNSANVSEPPRTFEDLREWVEANPGRFTYATPPNHVGSAFVRQLFYWAAGSADPFLEEFDQAVYDETAPVVWEYLNAIEPYLWREGQTYPELSMFPDLLANGEVDFAMEYDASRASNYIAQGQYPDTIRTYVLESGTLANVSYVAIPFNASNPAGAMVLANFLLSPEYQIGITAPAALGWMMAIDPTRLSAAEQTQLEETERGIATLSAEDLSSHALPEARASWVAPIEAGWEENVLKK